MVYMLDIKSVTSNLSVWNLPGSICSSILGFMKSLVFYSLCLLVGIKSKAHICFAKSMFCQKYPHYFSAKTGCVFAHNRSGILTTLLSVFNNWALEIAKYLNYKTKKGCLT